MFVNPDWVRALVEGHCLDTGTKQILAQERERSNLGVTGLSQILYTKDGLDRRASILQILVSEDLFDKSQNHSLDRKGKLALAITRGKLLRRLCVEHKWSEDDNQLALDLIGEPDPYGLHASLFLAALREQGAPKQHDRFLGKAEAYEYIGCYAQTELGHGSNVRGLETTATWIANESCFVLHSPSLTASKWWIGSLGKMATHALVIAQLIIDSKSYGPHSFIVQVRDLKTHEALPDIHIGDVGPKFGLNTMDNGFLLFNRLKVPHDNMLARHALVDPEENIYKRSPRSSSASVYSTLTYVRCVIVHRAASGLAKGVTIAIRYCAVRRQFQNSEAAEPAGQESQVLNYTTVQYRLFPLLAATFALHFMGKKMLETYEQQKKMNCDEIWSKDQISSNAEALADLHATSCGLKALASTIAADGLEMARRACGGHGYSSFAAIGNLYADYVPATTFEGDNYMIVQQVGRYLLKSARLVLQGEPPQNVTTDMLSYFNQNRQTPPTFDILEDDQQLIKSFGWRAAYLAFECLDAVDEEKRTWNSMLVDIWRLSNAHSEYLVISTFFQALEGLKSTAGLDAGSATITVLLQKLFRLYGLTTLSNDAYGFLRSSAVTIYNLEMSRKAVIPLMAGIRPHAVPLVDAWNFSDWQLDSSLGRFNGDVYQDLFRRASEGNPINDLVFDPSLNSDG